MSSPVPHRLTSSPEVLLEEFSVSVNGFLPSEAPLATLPDPYYAPWEAIIEQLPTLIESRQIRAKVDQIDVLSTDRLQSESEWRRTYVILSFLAHGYIWGGERASEILPPAISVPYLRAAEHFEIPPVATYAALNLWNFTSTTGDFTHLDTLKAQHTFTGTEDESWFYALSTAMEAQGAPIIPTMVRAMEAIPSRDYETMIWALGELIGCIGSIGDVLERMYERNRPMVFYSQIRPFLAGSKNMASAGLPRGVLYDEGDGRGEWRELRGGSNGQSSLIQFLDIVLGIEHASAGASSPESTSKMAGAAERPPPFHKEVRSYMPGPHRRFLEHVSNMDQLRDLALQPEADRPADDDHHKQLQKVYQAATKALSDFRNKHLQIVTRYIVIPSRMQAVAGAGRSVNLASASSEAAQNGKSSVSLTGTGGTALIPFLKQTRDETYMAGDLGGSKAAQPAVDA